MTQHEVKFDMTLPASARVSEQFFRGELNNLILHVVKGLKVPWDSLPEADQRKVIRKVDEAAMAITQKAVAVYRARGAEVAIGTLAGVSFKKGITATVEVEPNSGARHTLSDAVQDTVLLVFPGFKALDGGELAKPAPDNKSLPGFPDATPTVDKGAKATPTITPLIRPETPSDGAATTAKPPKGAGKGDGTPAKAKGRSGARSKPGPATAKATPKGGEPVQ